MLRGRTTCSPARARRGSCGSCWRPSEPSTSASRARWSRTSTPGRSSRRRASPDRDGRTWGVYAAEGPGVRLEAVDDGDGWRLSGTKPWCSLAGVLDAALVTAHLAGGGRGAVRGRPARPRGPAARPGVGVARADRDPQHGGRVRRRRRDAGRRARLVPGASRVLVGRHRGGRLLVRGRGRDRPTRPRRGGAARRPAARDAPRRGRPPARGRPAGARRGGPAGRRARARRRAGPPPGQAGPGDGRGRLRGRARARRARPRARSAGARGRSTPSASPTCRSTSASSTPSATTCRSGKTLASGARPW